MVASELPGCRRKLIDTHALLQQSGSEGTLTQDVSSNRGNPTCSELETAEAS
jgi:hypothetical protein